MLKHLLLIAFIAIGIVCCEPNCPIYSSFNNNATLINELSGQFYKIIATGTTVAQCQIQRFTIENNSIAEGYLQAQEWCLHMTNCTSYPDHYECDLVPVTLVKPPTLPTPQRNSIKIVGKIGTGDSLCLIYTYCRIGEEGVYLLCRQKPNYYTTVFLEAIERLINAFTQLHVIRVNQDNCVYPNSCPP